MGSKVSRDIPDDDARALRERLRKRLNGGRAGRARTSGEGDGTPGADRPAGSGAGTIFFARQPAGPVASAPKPTPDPPAEKVILEQAVDGQVVETDAGRTFLIERPITQIDPKWAQLDVAFERSVVDGDSSLWTHLGDVVSPGAIGAEDVLFLDLETTGLGSGPLFLIGTMQWLEGQLVVKQFFARDYSEERGAVALFLADAADKRLLVSFNGKSFDVPYLRVRAAATGLHCAIRTSHLDLLHTGRRIWKGRFGDCKLQTLERFVCGRTRRGDIPGWQIPQAYHDYVRTANAWQMVDCLEHNMLDLVTLADLMTRLPARVT